MPPAAIPIPPDSQAKVGPNRLRKHQTSRLPSIDEKDVKLETIDDISQSTYGRELSIIEECKPVIYPPFGQPLQRELLLDPFGLPLSPQPIPDEKDPLIWSHGRKMNVLAHISIMSFLSQFLATSIVSQFALEYVQLMIPSLQVFGIFTIT
jgi:hypothetical protein